MPSLKRKREQVNETQCPDCQDSLVDSQTSLHNLVIMHTLGHLHLCANTLTPIWWKCRWRLCLLKSRSQRWTKGQLYIRININVELFNFTISKDKTWNPPLHLESKGFHKDLIRKLGIFPYSLGPQLCTRS